MGTLFGLSVVDHHRSFSATLDLLPDLDSSGWFLWSCGGGKRLNSPGCDDFVLSCVVLSVFTVTLWRGCAGVMLCARGW